MNLTVIINWKSFVGLGIGTSLIIAAIKAEKESANGVMSKMADALRGFSDCFSNR